MPSSEWNKLNTRPTETSGLVDDYTGAVPSEPDGNGWRIGTGTLTDIETEMKERCGNAGDNFVPGLEEIENVLIAIHNLKTTTPPKADTVSGVNLTERCVKCDEGFCANMDGATGNTCSDCATTPQSSLVDAVYKKALEELAKGSCYGSYGSCGSADNMAETAQTALDEAKALSAQQGAPE